MTREEKRQYDREYHAKRSPEAKLRKQRLQDERKRRNLDAVRQYKLEQGCTDCGYSQHPAALEFDHIVPRRGGITIADMCKKGYSLDRIFDEVKKCEVVCANCHRVRTAETFWV